MVPQPPAGAVSVPRLRTMVLLGAIQPVVVMMTLPMRPLLLPTASSSCACSVPTVTAVPTALFSAMLSMPDTLEKVLTPAEQEATVPRAIWHHGQSDEVQLKKLLEDHNRWTGSKRARELLDTWDQARLKFVKVFPLEYKRALGEIHAKKAALDLASAGSVAIKKEAIDVK